MAASFHIEAKWFGFKKKVVTFSLSEKSRKASQSLNVLGGLLTWLARVLEHCSKKLNQSSPYQSKHEGASVFVVHKRQNNFGRFIKLLAFGLGSRVESLVIPEGRKGKGGLVFAKYMRLGWPLSCLQGFC